MNPSFIRHYIFFFPFSEEKKKNYLQHQNSERRRTLDSYAECIVLKSPQLKCDLNGLSVNIGQSRTENLIPRITYNFDACI